MTDDHLRPRRDPFDEPLHPLDELASAHLDGLADPAALSAVRDDPDFAARLDRLGRVRELLGAPVGAVDLDRREAAIAAAIAVVDERAGATGASGPATEVASFHVASARRSLPRRWRTVGIAAAVVAGALLAVPLLTMNDGKPDGDLAASSAEESTGDDADRTLADPSPADGGATFETEMALPTSPALGDFATYDDLADGVRAQLAPPGGGASTSPTTMGTTTTVPFGGSPQSGATGGTSGSQAPGAMDDGCPPPSDDEVVYEGDATVEGQPVTVEVVEDPDGDRTMEVRDPDSDCDVVDSRDL